MPQVSLIKTESYDPAEVERAVARHFELLGVGAFSPDARVTVKPNLIMRCPPERTATTHPAVIEAVVRQLQARGARRITIADSPGGLYNETVLRSVYRGCKIEEIANELGVRLNYDTDFETVSFPEGKTVKSFPIIRPVLDADVVITVPKLKTHMMTFYSGAVKNMFGAVPGVYKAEYHFSLPNKEDFCSMLVDLCQHAVGVFHRRFS